MSDMAGAAGDAGWRDRQLLEMERESRPEPRPSVEYGKTENLLKRDPETHKLIPGELRCPEFAVPGRWTVTEKIDGTNMRVYYVPREQRVEIRGRSDRANIPGRLLASMQEFFDPGLMSDVFDDYLGDQVELGTTVTIYGEGFGAGIQKGGAYGDEQRFAIFDVRYHRYHGLESWCSWQTVSELAASMGAMTVPLLDDRATIDEIMDEVGGGFSTHVEGADKSAVKVEGVVARTEPYLYDQNGSRVMFKLKGKDLA